MWVMTSEAYQPYGLVVGLALRIKRLPLEDVESSNSSVLSLELPPQCQLNVLLDLLLLVAPLLRGHPLTINTISLLPGTICPALILPTATFIVALTPMPPTTTSSLTSGSAISSWPIVGSPDVSLNTYNLHHIKPGSSPSLLERPSRGGSRITQFSRLPWATLGRVAWPMAASR